MVILSLVLRKREREAERKDKKKERKEKTATSPSDCGNDEEEVNSGRAQSKRHEESTSPQVHPLSRRQ